MIVPAHFPSRAHYKSIVSFIYVFKSVEEYRSLYRRYPYLYGFIDGLDKWLEILGKRNPLLVKPDSVSEILMDK